MESTDFAYQVVTAQGTSKSLNLNPHFSSKDPRLCRIFKVLRKLVLKTVTSSYIFRSQQN